MARLLLLLLLLAPAGVAQGVLALLDRATLVVEARLTGRVQGPRHQAEVRRIHRGPARCERVSLYLSKRISQHLTPQGRGWHLLFLTRLPGTVPALYAPLQRPLARIDLEDPGGREVAAHLARLVACRGRREAQATELLATAAGPASLAGLSAVADLVTFADLRRHAPVGAGRGLLKVMDRLPLPAASDLVHVLGVLRPEGWERTLLTHLERRPRLAHPTGVVLAAHLGEGACTLLTRNPDRRRQAGTLAALGATRLPGALPHLAAALDRPDTFAAASLALASHRSRAAATLLRQAIQRCPANRTDRAATLLQSLACIPRAENRRFLEKIARGEVRRPFTGLARRLLRR